MKTVTIEESLWQEIKDRVEQMRLACTGERELCDVQNDTEELAKLALECEGTLKLFYADGIYHPAAAPPLAQSGTGVSAPPKFYQHKRRGTVHEILIDAYLQTEPHIRLQDGEPLAIYRDSDGLVWACALSEFHDGRFEPTERPTDWPGSATPPPSAEPRAGYEVERVAFEAASRKLGFWWESPCTKRKCHAPGDKDYEPDTFDEKAWLLWLAARQSGTPPPSQSA